MLDLNSGQILVADYQGVYLIKLLGDVRLNLCIPFDNFINKMFMKDDFCSIIFDFSHTQGLDSTTLGLIAKLAVKSQEEKGIKTSVFNADAGIYRLLDVTGIIDLCEVIEDDSTLTVLTDESLPLIPSKDADNEDNVRKKVLEAHKVLISLNDTNKENFKDLIQTLSQT